MNDMEKASQIGIPAYNAEQEEKRKLLDFLLSHYNDGRRKNLFCVAVNLLTIKEIENILQTVKSDKDFQSMGKKEQASLQLQSQLPQAELLVIKNSGHEVNIDAPEDLGKALSAFFNL